MTSKILIKKLLFVLLLLLIALFVGLLIRTLMFPFARIKKSDTKAIRLIPDDTILYRLAGGIKIPLVSIVTSYLTVGGTDAIKYQELSKNIYRFMPVKINHSEQQSLHGTNEYISIENYMKMIEYFYYIMRNYDESSSD